MTAEQIPAGHAMDADHGQTMDTVVTGHHGHARVGLYTYPALSGSTERSRAELLADLGYPLPAWHRDALCREYPALNWFPTRGESLDAVRAVCARCLVRAECAAEALDDPTLHGVWAGLSQADRRALRRRNGGDGVG